MSTIKEKCNDCWVESVDENSVCYAGKHRIHYCSLHDSVSQMREALIKLRQIRDSVPMTMTYRESLWDNAEKAIASVPEA